MRRPRHATGRSFPLGRFILEDHRRTVVRNEHRRIVARYRGVVEAQAMLQWLEHWDEEDAADVAAVDCYLEGERDE